ncbi:ABC transporter substrate-binding protein [Litoribrevibacter albus]|uniref:ABC transporter substrate-binding protein n=2 Tax=Litoribrevibacter albus TaxID=1473156 RepID=A0AA37SAW3_9GAMM|nr:ABC transporter substrate-binding protein [Litoribrevibacter albus]GLQ32520.1 ABC transporter substrate-binding protein [Litoribrevibacter albus]
MKTLSLVDRSLSDYFLANGFQLLSRLYLCLMCLTFSLWSGLSQGAEPVNAEGEISDQQRKAIEYWLHNEFTQSTLSRDAQRDEFTWLANAALPYKGMTIRVVSERIDTHWYEANKLTKIFKDITGIQVVHELTGEDDVIKKISTQIRNGMNLYDAYINDSDLIGTHYRQEAVYPISDLLQDTSVTLPTLDVEDFIGLSFTTGPDGVIYQLPDQQFANLYWYRHDWFSRPDLKSRFKEIYGYELNVPQNWSAYEDIAEFFSVHVKNLDGQRVYGHMDYGRRDPSLGWRFSDAWLSMAGAGDPGIPNGLPVDEWGVRMRGCRPVAVSVERGGALDGPAAVYALDRYIDWLERFAPPQAKTMNFTEAGSVPGQGNIAQQIFWYTAFTAALSDPSLGLLNEDGTTKWRMAPSPKGAYWQSGMKLGYQDAGSWTFLKSTPETQRNAAWLYAQFLVSKSVSLKKTLVGLTPIRLSDINSEAMTKIAPKLGGLVEFYRSPARILWTPTGINVPDYPTLSQHWWNNVADAVEGKVSPQEAMTKMALGMEQDMQEMNFPRSECSPKLNVRRYRDYWLEQEGAPKPKLPNEKPQGLTFSYEQSLSSWLGARGE